jgi:hypothetical protein
MTKTQKQFNFQTKLACFGQSFGKRSIYFSIQTPVVTYDFPVHKNMYFLPIWSYILNEEWGKIHID